MNLNRYKNKYKVIFVGDSNVGKTSILNTYVKKCNNTPRITVGTEFFEHLSANLTICMGTKRVKCRTWPY